MSAIINPNQIVLQVTYDPLSGKTEYKSSQPMKLGMVVNLFCTVLMAIVQAEVRQAGADNPQRNAPNKPLGVAANGEKT
jgi:hypothetical protein